MPYSLNTNIEYSKLPVSLSLTLKYLQDAINKNKDKLSLSGIFNQNQEYQYQLQVVQNMTLHSEPPFLNFSIPAEIQLTSKGEKQNIQVVLEVQSQLALTPDWHISSNSKLLDCKWPSDMAQKPELQDKIIELLKNQLIPQVDYEISNNDILKNQIQHVWNKLETDPRPIPNSNIEMQLNLENIKSSQIHVGQEAINFVLEFNSQLFLLSPSLGQITPKQELPNIEIVDITEREAKLQVLAFMDYPFIENELNRNLQGKEFDVAGRTISLHNIILNYQSGQLLAQVKIDGGINGDAILSGIPSYDPTTKIFELNNFQFDFKTNNFLMKAASSLFKNQIKSKMQELTRVNVESEINKYLVKINEQISNLDLKNGLYSNSEILGCQINSFDANDSGIEIVISAQSVFQLVAR